MARFVFFSDLDGTLLDRDSYAFDAAKPALARIKETGSALVFCTSKTKAETLEYIQKLRLKEPFIVENGGAVYIPLHYFKHEIEKTVEENGLLLVPIGTRADKLKKAVDELAQKIEIKPFHQMSVNDIATDTGLTAEQAAKALDRHFTASFKLLHENDLQTAKRFVEQKGFTFLQGGRYCSVVGGSDKGQAVQLLLSHYKKDFENVVSVGLGDAPNDFDMLRACDRTFLVAQKDGSFASDEFAHATGIGPVGWNNAVLDVLKNA